MGTETKSIYRIGDQLKLLRFKLKLNQQQFSEQIGLSQSWFSSLEKNKALADLTTVKAIVQTFNVSIDWLIYDRGEMFMDKNKKYPDLSMIEPLEKSEVKIPDASYNNDFAHILSMAVQVLQSNTQYSDILKINIQCFAKSIDNEKKVDRRLSSIETLIRDLKSNETLKSMMDFECPKPAGIELKKEK